MKRASTSYGWSILVGLSLSVGCSQLSGKVPSKAQADALEKSTREKADSARSDADAEASQAQADADARKNSAEADARGRAADAEAEARGDLEKLKGHAGLAANDPDSADTTTDAPATKSGTESASSSSASAIEDNQFLAVNAKGIGRYDSSGRSFGLLREEQDVRWCQTDPRADVVWYLVESSKDTYTLKVLDLRDRKSAPLTLGDLPPLDRLTIVYGRAKLGDNTIPYQGFEAWIDLTGGRPELRASYKCDPDYGDVQECRREHEARKKELESTLMQNPDEIARLVERGGSDPLFLMPAKYKRLPKLPLESPECVDDCGSSISIPATPFYAVLTISAEMEGETQRTRELYDPERELFLDLARKKGSRTPLRRIDPFTMYVSADGKAFIEQRDYALDSGIKDRVVSFGKKGTLFGRKKSQVCGWIGPSYRLFME